MKDTGPFLNEALRPVEADSWIILSLLALALAFVVVRLIYGRYWRRYRQALLFNQESQKLIQERNVLLMQAAVSMNVLGVLSIGFFVFMLFEKIVPVKIFPDNIYGLILACLAVALFIGGKHLINNFLGELGNNTNASAQINHQWLINLKNFGFFLLPFTAASPFISNPLDTIIIYSGLGLLVFMLILNYIKGFLLLFQFRISIYYGILYLCSLEILPVLIIWKVIQLMTK